MRSLLGTKGEMDKLRDKQPKVQGIEPIARFKKKEPPSM